MDKSNTGPFLNHQTLFKRFRFQSDLEALSEQQVVHDVERGVLEEVLRVDGGLGESLDARDEVGQLGVDLQLQGSLVVEPVLGEKGDRVFVVLFVTVAIVL